MVSSKEQILFNIKNALKRASNLPESPEGTERLIEQGLASVTPADPKALMLQFKDELEKVAGEFFKVRSIDEMAPIVLEILRNEDYHSIAVAGDGVHSELGHALSRANKNISLTDVAPMPFELRRDALAKTDTAIIKADYAIADIGSIVIVYDHTPSNIIAFLPARIFAIVSASGLVANQFELFDILPPQKAKDMVLITGPSRTADIEKVLVLGAHGPRRLTVFFLDEPM